MSEVAKIALTALATIIVGVIVYVAGQLVSKLVLDPLQEQRKVIGDIHVALEFWTRELVSLMPYPAGRTEERDRAEKEFRVYASRLVATTSGIARWLYRVALWLGAPRPDDVRLAARELIGLSNNLYSETATRREDAQANRQRMANIRQYLALWVHAGEEPIGRREESS